jgi:hypothetical protein
VIEIAVLNTDADFLTVDSWARHCCASYVGFSIVDIVRMSLPADEVAVYRFLHSEDAALFKLRWRSV